MSKHVKYTIMKSKNIKNFLIFYGHEHMNFIAQWKHNQGSFIKD